MYLIYLKLLIFTLTLSVILIIILKYLSRYYCGNNFGITKCANDYLNLGLNNFLLLISLRIIVVDLFNNKISFHIHYLIFFIISYFSISYYLAIDLYSIFDLQRYALIF